MQNYVWVSEALNAEAALGVEVRGDVAASPSEPGEGLERNMEGLPVAREFCPTRLWSTDEGGEYARPVRVETGLPDLFYGGGCWIVSERAAAIIGQFDLGDGALYLIENGIFHADRATRHPGEFFTWVFGNTKSAFLPEETAEKRRFGVSGRTWKFPFRNADGNIAVSPAALDGPEVWMDQGLFKSVFLSRELGDALSAAGLSEAFFLKKARVAPT